MVEKKKILFPHVKLGDATLTINDNIAKRNQETLAQLEQYKRSGKTFIDDKFKLQWGRKLGESEKQNSIRNKENLHGVVNYGNGDFDDFQHLNINYYDPSLSAKKNKNAGVFVIDAKSDKFIEGEAEPSDIQQGEAGDCWFLSSLCSFANYTNEGTRPLLTRVRQEFFFNFVLLFLSLFFILIDKVIEICFQEQNS